MQLVGLLCFVVTISVASTAFAGDGFAIAALVLAVIVMVLAAYRLLRLRSRWSGTTPD